MTTFAHWWHNLTRWGLFGAFSDGPGLESPAVQAPTVVIDTIEGIETMLEGTEIRQEILAGLVRHRASTIVDASAHPETSMGTVRIPIRSLADGDLLGYLPESLVPAFSSGVRETLRGTGVELDGHLWTSRIALPGQLITAWVHLPETFRRAPAQDRRAA